jgi:Calx-beta domain-containing protein/CARDB protein
MKTIALFLMLIFLTILGVSLPLTSGKNFPDRSQLELTDILSDYPPIASRRKKNLSDTVPGIRPDRIVSVAHKAVGRTSTKPPVINEEEIAERRERIESVNRTVPLAQGEVWTVIPRPTTPPTRPVIANPILQNLSRTAIPEALGPNDLRYQVVHDLTLSEIGQPSVVDEPSVGNVGDTVFLTGNWYAARSTDQGRTFNYVDPFHTFPASNSGFCCDQITNYAPQQDMLLWALQYVEDGSTNTLRIARAMGSSDVNQNRWTYYSLNPQDFGFPTGTWFDFPNLTVSANYLYITTNVFKHDRSFTGAVLVRYLLSELAEGGTIHGEYFAQNRLLTDVGALRCTEGAGFTIFCAGHKSSSQVTIFRWDDGAGSLISRDDINLNPYTRINCESTCDAVAVTPDGTNWAGRADGRILGAWVSQGIIGMMWAARQDSAYPYPYTIIAEFDQSSRNLISQTPVWSPDTAFMYPTVAVNSARQLAGLISYGGGAYTPGSNIWISDDVESGFSPLAVYGAAPGSTNGPNADEWGDFQTVRRHKDFTNTWVAATFRLQGGSSPSNIVPRYLWFGRVRDLPPPSPGSANLTKFRPSGWSDAIVLSTVPGTTSDSNSFATGNTLYADWAVINSGDAWTESKFYIDIYVDNIKRGSWYSAPVLPNDYVYINDFSIGSLTAGTHTIKIIADPTNSIAENNESDNEYVRTINVLSGPANDNFNSGQAITGTSGTVNGSTLNATKELGEPDHAGNSGRNSTWYQLQAPASGSMTITTTGSSFDTLLGVYIGNEVSSLITIASNDDDNFPNILTSKVTFNAVAGTTYRIAVDGFDGASGATKLNWTLNTPASSVQFNASNYDAGEAAGSVTITVTRTGDTSNAATVDFETSDGSALQTKDYQVSTGTLTFASGQTTKTFSVLIVDDAFIENSETVNLTLKNPTGATLGSPTAATIAIQDNDFVAPSTNPLDNLNEQFFVQQHYFDFLSRLPDQSGFNFWIGQITQCGGNTNCIANKRLDVSNAFFFELEYQQTAAYVLRLYRAAYGNNQPFANPDPSNLTEAKKIPSYDVFSKDRARLTGSANLSQDQLALANLFASRTEFITKYPAGLTLAQFVDAVIVTIKNDEGVDLTAQRSALIGLSNRGTVLYRIADDNLTTNPINNRSFIDAEYNRAFVASQYFGYLRRNADIGGFVFWLGQVNSGPLRDVGKQHAMVCSFITSTEYQSRFSSVITHSNAECPH